MILAVQADGLSQREQVLLPVISHQAFCDGFVAGSNPGIAERSHRMHIPTAFEDRIHDCQSGRSGDIADDVVQLQIHLIQRLLHVLNVASRHIDEAGAVSQ